MIASIRPSSSSATSSSARVGTLRAQQLQMSAGDRERGAELVRGVVDEPLLALEQRPALLGAGFSATRSGVHAAPGVPRLQRTMAADEPQRRPRLEPEGAHLGTQCSANEPRRSARPRSPRGPADSA